jgi:hypothetical protein
MGFLQDLEDLQQQADAVQAHRVLDGLAAERRRAGELLSIGRAGTARIDARRDTGLTVDDDPSLEFDLLVTVDGAEPYAVMHRQVISRWAVTSLQPGATVAVRVDPADPRAVLIA